ncbi:hypothetical protein BDV37DRAFT_289860 [Aspergillus pseudonomiae]|uniref:Uncharacterized protein n=1 Tax=Aspergillus pseudonomiae TaxID=1506151 RepID=A0A5N7CSL4_9EURO|nr:uncharacterized protein BDV37DRAFT_289860 [Aspergillus pseudonomiae]KAE8396929.1 hypothetical protein BDV37DRAFT_289860 [Aspergillus pseudonomiae]
MSKFPKKPLQALMDLARVNKEKLVAPLPDNLTSKTVLKTEDARIDLHKNLATPDEVTARIQANTGAKTSSVKKWIREAKQKGHSGTHKNISEVKFNRNSLDIDKFEKEVMEKSA